jgi:hypothetical protein
MRAPYRRLFADPLGVSAIEEGGTELESGFAVPPAEPLYSGPFLATGGSFWVGAPTNWAGDAPHPAPRRMIFVTVQGVYEVTVGDGTTHRFPPGSVLIVEDTTGAGHSTKITSIEDVVVFAVNLVDQPNP